MSKAPAEMSKAPPVMSKAPPVMSKVPPVSREELKEELREFSATILKEELREFSATMLQTALDRVKEDLKTAVAEAVAEASRSQTPRAVEKPSSKKVPAMHAWMRQKPMRHGETGSAGRHEAKEIPVDPPESSRALRSHPLLSEKPEGSSRMLAIETNSGEREMAAASYEPLDAVEGEGSEVAVSQGSSCAEGLRKVVLSTTFEEIIAIIVLLNAVCIGLETHLLDPRAHDKGLKDGYMILFHHAETAFCLIYTTELFMRMFVYGLDFLRGKDWRWNVFDSTIVSFQILEQIGRATHGKLISFSLVNTLRLLRLLRITRLLRLLKMVDELQRIVVSIMNSLSSLAWVLVLLVVLVYFFSVVFTQMTLVHISPDDPQYDDLMHFFGCIPRTALTLFESVFGGLSWDEPVQLLVASVSPFTSIIFCIYIAFCQIALMNVVTGVFVDKAMRAAHAAEEQTLCTQVATMFFDESNPHRQISWDIFQAKLEEEHMTDYFKAIDIDAAEAKNLFALLDTDNSGGVDCSELVNGLLRLRGTAGALEVSLMLREMSYMFDRIDLLFSGKVQGLARSSLVTSQQIA
eukprot:TRINITY_DN5673_c0_g3_i1.p1 TRINITY_DN5673_c0_g3~~TRINITY_DN5673_c0_g3_i1.p1  ORF type:complete len:577 (+),score=115.49 TRINITY_DN5673_c0_g3_i1:87-1817(+)